MALLTASRLSTQWGDEPDQVGSITLIIQDGRIIQIDKSEKIRLRKPEYIDGGRDLTV